MPQTRERAKILVVDDEPAVRSVLSKILRSEGHQLCVASGGLEAARRLRSDSFDAMISDIVMPEMDGLELCRSAQKLGAFLPILLLTGLDRPRRGLEAFEAGAVQYLIKPFELHEVKARVDAMLRLKRDQDGLRRTVGYLHGMNTRKNDYLAHLSHEVGIPLSFLRGALSTLAADARSVGVGGLLKYAVAHRNLDRLLRLSKDLQDLTSIEAGRFNIERKFMDLGVLIEESVLAASAAAEEAGIRLEVRLPSGPIPVRADAVRIAQVLENLLSNALKFSPKGSTVRVEGEREESRVAVRVMDEGLSLAGGDAERIFERYVSLDPVPGRGIGLGLAISKDIIERHDGRIGVETGEGGGAVIRFELPLVRPEAEEAGDGRG